MWSRKFKAQASIKDYDDVLTGVVKIEDGISSEDQKIITKMNKRGYSDLILACSEPVSFNLVETEKSTLFPNGDANLAWLALENKYEPRDGQSKIKLKRELAQSKLESGEDPEEWITKLLQKTARLIQLGGSFTEEDLMLHILCNLPEEFENTVENNEKALNEGTLTLASLRSSLDSKFKRVSNGKTIGDNALYSGERNGRINGKCGHCGKTGHTAENCWTLPKNKHKIEEWKARQKTSRNGNHDSEKSSNWVPYNCGRCGKKGHKRSDCPEASNAVTDTREIGFTTSEKIKKKKRREQRRNRNTKDDACREIGFVSKEQSTSNESISHDLWIADSAATCHMGPNLNGCTEIRIVSEEVTVGDGKGVRITARAVYRGIVHKGDGSKVAIKLENYACCPGLTKRLFSVNTALDKGFDIKKKTELCVCIKTDTNFISITR